jgi:pyrroline-5-carboxylate reductase
MIQPLKIGFLGAGKMASALATGFVQAGLVPREHILASDPAEAARAHFTEMVGSVTTGSNHEVVAFAQIVVLAVKPGLVSTVLEEIRPQFSPAQVLISIAAGVRIERLEAALGPVGRVVRVMPNTPALVKASATAFALGKSALAEDAEIARNLFSSVGLVVQVPESMLDAVTGLSGSGPAYACLMIEALSDGGVAAGLPRDVATKLAAQTLMGTARMVLETGLHPGTLKDMVTSPGGTTIEGLHELERGGVRGSLIQAVRAAAQKSTLLGQR